MCGASEKLGSDPKTRAPQQHVCCCSSRTWYPRNMLKMNSGRWHWVCREEGFVCAMLPVGAGLQKERFPVPPDSSKDPF